MTPPQLCDERFKHRGDQKKHLVRKHPNAVGVRTPPLTRNDDDSDRLSDTSEHLQRTPPQGPQYAYASPHATFQPLPQASAPTAEQPSQPATPPLCSVSLTADSQALPVGYYMSSQAPPPEACSVLMSMAPTSLAAYAPVT